MPKTESGPNQKNGLGAEQKGPQKGEDQPLRTGGPKGSDLYQTAWVFYLGLAAIALVWIGIRDQGISTALLWQQGLEGSEILRSLALDLTLGVLSAAAIVGAWETCERLSEAAAEVGVQLRAMLAGLTVSEALGLALFSGIGEELFFRGALQGSFPGWQGWLVATVLFALLHGGPGKHFRWWTLFAALAGGVMGAWLMLRGNLTAPLTTHVAVNGFQLLRAARVDKSV